MVDDGGRRPYPAATELCITAAPPFEVQEDEENLAVLEEWVYKVSLQELKTEIPVKGNMMRRARCRRHR